MALCSGFLLSVFVFFVLAGFGMFPLILFVPDYKASLTLSVMATLMTFIIPFFALPFIIKLLHQRPYWSVAMPRLHFEKWNFLTAFWVVSLAVSVATGFLVSMIGVIPMFATPIAGYLNPIYFTVTAMIGMIALAGIDFYYLPATA